MHNQSAKNNTASTTPIGTKVETVPIVIQLELSVQGDNSTISLQSLCILNHFLLIHQTAYNLSSLIHSPTMTSRATWLWGSQLRLLSCSPLLCFSTMGQKQLHSSISFRTAGSLILNTWPVRVPPSPYGLRITARQRHDK